jgi:hypothetical protein
MKQLVLGLVLLVGCSGRHDGVVADGGTSSDGMRPMEDAGLEDAGLDAMPDARSGSDVPDPVDEPSLPCAGTLAFPEPPTAARDFNDPKTAVVDVDGDGVVDIVEVDTFPSASIALGLGNGTFAPPVTYPLTDYPMGLAVADLDGDGSPDIATAQQGQTIEVLLNHGDGTFAPAVAYQVAEAPRAIAIGDLSGDGKPEIVITHEGFQISVVPNFGDGTFGTPIVYPASNNPDRIAIGDVTGDGRQDVVVTDDFGGVDIYANTGSGGLAPRFTYPTADEPRGLALVDIVGDSGLDIVLATHTADANFLQQISVLENVGGAFPSEDDYVVGGVYPAPISVGDVNDDGVLDVVLAGSSIDPRNSVGVAYGLVGGGFAPSLPYRTLQATGSALADVDGDGKLDIVVQTRAGAEPLLNNGDGTFAQPTPISLSFIPDYVAVRDLDGDGADDVIVDGVDNNGAYAGVFFGDGHGGLAPLLVQNASFGPAAIQTGDIDGDGQADIVIPDRYQALANVWIGHGRAFTTSIVTLPQNAVIATLVDLDHDGVRELVGVSNNGNLSVMKFHSNGTFTATAGIPVGTPYGIAYGDVNGDGNQDVVVSTDTGVMKTFLGNGNGGWLSTAVSTGHAGWIALGDVDGDHVLDLVTNSEIEHGNGDGTFVFPQNSQFFVGDSIRLRDINGDSYLDVISGSGLFGIVWVALNNGDGTFRVQSYAGGIRSVAVGDFDKDGRPDLVTASIGNPSEIRLQFGRCLP